MIFFVAGVLVSAAVAIFSWLVLTAIANAAVLPVSLKVSLLIIGGLLVLATFVREAIERFFSGNIESVAVDLETRYPDLKGRLIASIQFARMGTTPGYSAELILSTHEQAVDRAGAIEFHKAASLNPVKKPARFLAAIAVIALALIAVAPGMFSYSYQVYSNPMSVVAPPLGYQLMAFPGSVQWIKYRDIEIGGLLFGDDLPTKAAINHRLTGGSWQKTDVDISRSERHHFEWGDSVVFSVNLRQVDKSFDYFVEAGGVRTEMERVEVVDRPRVTGIRLSLVYPGYTGLAPTVIDENNGSFSAVAGSRANMTVSTNVPVQTAALVFSDSSRMPLSVENGTAAAMVAVDSSRAYHIELRDHLGEGNPDPIQYYITAIPDEYPSVDVIRPGFDVNLNDEMMLPLKIHIFDDYGFSSLVLKYTVVSQGRQSEENVVVLHFSERVKTEGEIEFNWDLNQLNLFPGDYVSYYLEVADNDQISGPKVTATRHFVARLPSLDEMIAQVETENAQRITNAEDLLRTGKDLSQRLKNAARKLQAQNNRLEQADWQHQKELENVLNKNNEMIQQIERLAENMERSLEELNDKALLSREILEKLAQLQKLFEEVATPEMKEAQRRLMEALQEMDPRQLEDALRDFQLSQDELLERLERTLSLLKRMQLEQTMEAIIRKAEDLARRQEEVNDRTQTSPPRQLPTLTDEELHLKEALSELQAEADSLDDLAQKAGLQESSELTEFKKALTQTDAGENMERMAQALDRQEQDQAGTEGQQAYGKLMQMIDAMQQQMLSMKGGQNEALQKEMSMALQDANNLSRMQEDLLRDAREVESQSLMLRDLAAIQQDLSGAVSGLENRISDLGKQSPFMAAELRQLVGNAASHMEMAIKEFDSKRGRQAVGHQREAMMSLDRASIRLMESLSQQQQSQSGANCNKGTSMLQGLADRQNQLNQTTQQQLEIPGPDGRPGQGSHTRQTLQRLAGEQGAIRKSLEDLNREFSGSRQILGRLDDIGRAMGEVEEALASGDAGPGLVDGQLKIYSRLLEASRSLYRKDFSEQRRSTTSTNQAFHIPPELSREILSDRVKLEDRLRQYLGDSYPPQYEEQIKAYFRALLQTETDLMRLENSNGVQPGGQ